MEKLVHLLAFSMVLGGGGSDSGNGGGDAGVGGLGGSGGSNGAAGAAGESGSAGEGGGAGEGGQGFSPNPPLVIGSDERPAAVEIPSDYDPSRSYPLLVGLHGHGADGDNLAVYLQLRSFVDDKELVLVLPNAIPDANGENAWNATEACCATDDTIDDVGYLSGLIDEAKQTYHIDSRRVYLIGHSNGGFMSFRMLCEASDRM